MLALDDKLKLNILKILTVFLFLLAIVSVVQGVRNAAVYSQDFQWDAAKVLSLGMNPYEESLHPSEALRALGYEEYYKQMEANQFPSLLLLLFPFTLLPPLTARYVWIACNLLFTLAIPFLLKKTFFKKLDTNTVNILSLLMVAGTPWRNQIGVGQHTLFSFVFFLLAVYFSEKENQRCEAAAGLCLAVSYFKYTLTAPLALYFLFKGKYRLLVISVIPHMIGTVYSALMIGDTVWGVIVKPLKVAAALTSEGSMDIGALFHTGSYTVWITAFIFVVLAVFSVRARGRCEGEYVVSVLLLSSLIMTYHRSYDYFVLILPFADMLGERGKKRPYMMICYMVIVVFLFFILRIFDETPMVIYCAAVLYYCFTIVYAALCPAKTSRNPGIIPFDPNINK